MVDYSDFRSDTVTRPTPKMREAMAQAIVGDDVLGDDPTVQELERMAAEITGKEAALYVPSGTMGNTIAIKVWTRELDEVIVEERSHIYNMESTQMTFISRVQPRPLPSERGTMDPAVIEENIRKPSVHLPRTSVICLENSHNNWSGAVIGIQNIRAVKEVADRHGLKLHMDGARIFNASHSTGIPVRQYSELADSMMFCLSKGLCAPVGSLLVGPQDFIDYGRRIRKALGGAMRQVGIIAAAGITALTEMTERLKEDNARAKRLATAIAKFPGIVLDPDSIDTNIIIFDLDHPKLSIPDFLAKLNEHRILALPTRGGVRFVTHHDVDDTDVDNVIAAFQAILSS